MSSTPTAASRIQAQQHAMAGKQVACDRCGSNFLRRVSVTTYRSGGYGTVSIQEDTDAQPFDILICVCGYPVTPQQEIGRRAGGIREQGQKNFLSSVKLAQDFLDNADPDVIKAAATEGMASKYVEGRVEDLTDRINGLEATVLKPQHEAAEMAAEVEKAASHKNKGSKAANDSNPQSN